ARSVVEFIFSSRRRHTRSKRDWSSDVCSSDLSRATNFHSRFRGSGRHIIQKNQLRADVDCLGDLLKGVALDLHGKIWELLADGSKRGGQRTRGQDVIVLNQCAIA